MECNVVKALPINYCGDTLHIGTTAATDPVFVFFEDMATGRSQGMPYTGTLPDVDVDMPNLSPGHTYRIHISGSQEFTPYASEGNIGTDAVRVVHVEAIKVFDDDGEVENGGDQYLVVP